MTHVSVPNKLSPNFIVVSSRLGRNTLPGFATFVVPIANPILVEKTAAWRSILCDFSVQIKPENEQIRPPSNNTYLILSNTLADLSPVGTKLLPVLGLATYHTVSRKFLVTQKVCPTVPITKPSGEYLLDFTIADFDGSPISLDNFTANEILLTISFKPNE